MKAGFIGAGKVGFSLGKYLVENGISVTGYYSRNQKSAEEAARFTNTEYFCNLANLVDNSDTLFLTVPDRAISEVFSGMRNLPIENKNICHCSGSISSTAFFCAKELGAYCYSVHPLCAISDKYTSYKELYGAYFTIEGSAERLDEIKSTFSNIGNPVVTIEADKKALYHTAAVMASNLILALTETATQLLTQCGFEYSDAEKALAPLIEKNAKKAAEVGAVNALTGPIERNDIITVQNHLNILDGDIRSIYIELSRQLVKLAQKKHPELNYDEMENALKMKGND